MAGTTWLGQQQLQQVKRAPLLFLPVPLSLAVLIVCWAPLCAKVSLCEPYRHTKRYRDMVEYYSWKLERRYSRNMAYKVRGCTR